MRNVWIICRKELRSYFVSPIAYLLLAMFAVIFGFFFWNVFGYFVIAGMESQMRGSMFPMNINDEIADHVPKEEAENDREHGEQEIGNR